MTGLLSLAHTAIGCGVGLLVADKINSNKRQATAIALISVALASAVPVVVNYVTCHLNAPESHRGVKKRLRSIREDSGLHDEAHVF
ncbi:MAG TPA: hypothetical protein VIT91_09435 [Chthoniobacterales bacterium]